MKQPRGKTKKNKIPKENLVPKIQNLHHQKSFSLSLSLSLSPRSLCVSVFGFYIVFGSVLHAILLIAALSSQIKLVPEGWGFVAGKEESLETVRNTSYFRGVIFFLFFFFFFSTNLLIACCRFSWGKKNIRFCCCCCRCCFTGWGAGSEEACSPRVTTPFVCFVFPFFFPCSPALFCISRSYFVRQFISSGRETCAFAFVLLPPFWIFAQVFFSFRLVSSRLDSGH